MVLVLFADNNLLKQLRKKAIQLDMYFVFEKEQINIKKKVLEKEINDEYKKANLNQSSANLFSMQYISSCGKTGIINATDLLDFHEDILVGKTNSNIPTGNVWQVRGSS